MSARDYQRAAIDALFDYWGEGGGNPLVDMATGTGKSVVISTLIREMLQMWPDLRILALVHVKELVEQNAKALLRTWPQAPVGINSAGLGRRDVRSQILFASIQSVHKLDAYVLGKRDLVLIDGAHLTPRSGSGMYRTLLDKLREAVPDMRVAGLTATPYRLDSGRLDDGDDRLFDQVVYTYGIGDGVRDGWLSPLIAKATKSEVDVTGVARRGGEFVAGELERAADKSELTEAAVAEIVERGVDRKAWIVFCAGVQHAENVRNAIRRRGIMCETVTGDTPGPDRDRIIRDFRAGRIRCLTNAMVLTTGFDVPGVDLIAMLRPTLSTGLYVQKLGRGTRPVFPSGFDPNTATAEERVAAIASGPKPNCLVLDFSGNVRRHGPVDTIVIAGRPKKGEVGQDATGKVGIDDVRARPCPNCEELVSTNVFECRTCGHVFERPPEKPVHERAADDTPVMAGTSQKQVWSDVREIAFNRHEKRNDPTAPPTMRVEYSCGLTIHQEWICFQHPPGFALNRAHSWWRQMRGQSPAPKTIDEAIDRAEAGELSLPSGIVVRPKPGSSFVEILSRRFDGDPPRLRQSYRPMPKPTPVADCWRVLGIEPYSTIEHVKTRFRVLAREHHPDVGGTDEKMAAINAAYAQAMNLAGDEVPF